ncbi:MAG: tetratricopeptide repeat protein [Desulfobacteraceae bacterium]
MLPFLVFQIIFYADARDLTSREWQTLRKVKKLYEEEKMQEIVTLLKPLAEQDDPHEAVYSYLSTAYIQQGKYKEANIVLEQAVRVYPEIYPLQYNYAVTAMHLEKYRTAISAFNQVRTIQEEKGEDSSRTVFYIANAYYILEQYDRAIELITPLIRDEKTVNRQMMQLAVNCHIMKSDWEKAQKVLSRWIEIMPTENQSWQMLGNVFVQQKKYKEAAGAYEIALLSGSKNITPANMFSLYRFLLIHSEAARWAGDPEYVDSHWLKQAEELYRAALFDKAIEVLKNRHRAEKNPEVLLLEGKCLLCLDKKDEAVKVFLSCKDIPLPETGDLRDARRKRDEICGRAYLLAGEIRWLQKNWLEARDIFRELSYFPGYEDSGKLLSNTMQYVIDSRP